MGHNSTRPLATLRACRARWRTALYVLTALLTAGPAAAQTPAAQADRVIDGDTISVRLDGPRYTVPVTGVDTPETTHATRAVEPDGPEAADDTTAREDDKAAPERPDGCVGQTREPRDPDRQPRVAPEVATSSQADQDAARRDREPSTQAFNRETASDRQRDSGPSR